MHPPQFASHLASARLGNPDALHALFADARLWLERCALAYLTLGDTGRSDFVQETLRKAVESFHTFRGTTLGEFRTWLSEILRNHVFNVVRRAAPTEPLPADAALPAPDATPSAQVLAREEEDRVRQAIDRLPEPLRAAWRLHLDGQTQDQIAALLGVDRSTVSRHLKKARDILRREFREEE